MADSTMGTVVALPTRKDPTRDNVFKSVDDSMANFLSRPILAASYTWTPLQATPFGATLNPWTLFFGNSRVINRLNNYMLLRANVHVRFLINGNGFYYGRLMADYQPLPTNDNVTAASTSVFLNATAASQRLKVFIDPADCCANEMDLPFVWPRDALSPVAAEWAQMGVVNIRELTGLKHANAAVQPLTISVFVWATDVQYAVPTSVPSSSLVAQAGDEYGSGPVENIATAVGGAAAHLAKLPVVGPYARATTVAASAAARLARAAGWSRPAIIADDAGMRPRFISSLAPSDAGDNVTKLTVDSKQEVSVDTSVIGIDLPDELSIAGIGARESFLTTFAWGTTAVSGDHLYNMRVAPNLCSIQSGTVYLPAMAFATLPFAFWRGKLRFRFQIVASAYHRGRLRVVYDPSYIKTLESNVQYTRIVDIAEERDIIIEVDWAQTAHYLPVGSPANGNSWSSSTAFASASANTNGVLGIYVMNDLATPNSTVNNDISINVYVSAVDLEVAAPRAVGNGTTGYNNLYNNTVQAGEEMDNPDSGNEPGCGPPTSDITFGNAPNDSHDADVYFGEVVTSMRQLLRRYNYDFTTLVVSSSATNPSIYVATLPDTPVPTGYNSVSYHTTTAGGKWNYVMPSLARLLPQCFVASRGSQRVKYMINGPSSNALTMTVTRAATAGAPVLPVAAVVLPITSGSNYMRAILANRPTSGPGAVVTPPSRQPVIETELPYYKNVRFDEARIANVGAALATSPFITYHNLEVTTPPGVATYYVDRYTAVGEDYSLAWWQGCPPLVAFVPPA